MKRYVSQAIGMIVWVVLASKGWGCCCSTLDCFFASALTLPARPPLPLSLLRLHAASKPNLSTATAKTTATTTSNSSVGRLRFCYDRLEEECPDEDYLRQTPSLVIAADLRSVLSEKSASTPLVMLPEESCIAVLDAYMVAYRDARRKKGDKEQRKTQEYSEKMDAVVDGMQSTLLILNQHDTSCFQAFNNNANIIQKDNCNNGGSTKARTVDPYATILHMLLELTIDAVSDKQSVHWATKSLEVLSALESNRVLVIAAPEQAAKMNANTNARILQYNKVLKGLANSSCTIGAAVVLLDRMCKNCNIDDCESFSSSSVTRAMENLTIGPGILPDAKSFATVLGSRFLDDTENSSDSIQQKQRFVASSVSFGVYEGYLEKFLKRSFGEEQLAELLGE